MKDLTSPKEKAKELIELFYDHAFHPSLTFNTSDNGGHTKKIALKHVDSIINLDCWFPTLESTKEFTKYWIEVQSELHKK